MINYNKLKPIKAAILLILIFFVWDISIIAQQKKYDLDDDIYNSILDSSIENQQKRIPNQIKKKQKALLIDDNLYLLNDDFDFGIEELELLKIELDPKDVETAKAYEEFLNEFFNNSNYTQYTTNHPLGRGFNDTKSSSNNLQSPRIPRQQGAPANLLPPGKLGFGLSTILGLSIPMGQNLTSNYSIGSNFGVHIKTPISFSIANREINLGSEIFFSTMSASDANSSSYKLTNLVGNFSIPLINNKKSGHKLVEIKMGLGASPSTIGDFNKILLSIPVDINYYLPINFKGFGLALNLHAQETLGIPTDIGTEDTKATTEFINLGFFITTPLVF